MTQKPDNGGPEAVEHFTATALEGSAMTESEKKSSISELEVQTNLALESRKKHSRGINPKVLAIRRSAGI